ncbi:MAG: hypothetical protein U0Q18_31220 [Bryobacteraceae bacterium]
MRPAFVIATDLTPADPWWPVAVEQTEGLATACAPVLGFEPRVLLSPLADLQRPEEADEVFVLPSGFDFSVWEREMLGARMAEWRRAGQGCAVHTDLLDLGHPLLVQCFADLVSSALAGAQTPPQRVGLLLVASGHGDSASRAQSYRLMRLLWEQLGLGGADVAFVRNAQTFLGHALDRCARDPLHWLLVPQMQWPGEHLAYARVILENFQRGHAEAASWRLLEPPGPHPAISAWLAQRMLQLWREKRSREATRTPSARHQDRSGQVTIHVGSPATAADGLVAEIRSAAGFRELLTRVLPSSHKYLIKVTWHGYAPGTFTDPAALDLLLEALPGKAVILEGHTSSRNLGGADWEWETEGQCHRAWIRQQEAEYLHRTGLAEVIQRHAAQYLNVTEAYWDGRMAPERDILQWLAERGVQLHHPELAAFLPQELWDLRGTPFISLAKFKGPTRLGISNLFGLIPVPLRSAWHGPNITHFARVCCDLARMYGALFPTFGVVEALYSAVRWDRQGLYRSRWGNYDILADRALVTLSERLPAADILASRLQGQDVTRSAFFDVVRQDLGWPSGADRALPAALPVLFA